MLAFRSENLSGGHAFSLVMTRFLAQFRFDQEAEF